MFILCSLSIRGSIKVRDLRLKNLSGESLTSGELGRISRYHGWEDDYFSCRSNLSIYLQFVSYSWLFLWLNGVELVKRFHLALMPVARDKHVHKRHVVISHVTPRWNRCRYGWMPSMDVMHSLGEYDMDSRYQSLCKSPCLLHWSTINWSAFLTIYHHFIFIIVKFVRRTNS